MILAGFASLAVSGSLAQADESRACLLCIDRKIVEVCSTVNHRLDFYGCSVIESVTGAASGIAVGRYATIVHGAEEHCPPAETFNSWFDAGYLGSPASDAAVIFERHLGISGGGSLGPGLCGFSFSLTVDLNSPLTPGLACFIEGTSTGAMSLVMEEHLYADTLERRGTLQDKRVGSAGFDSEIVIETSGPLQFAATLSVNAESEVEFGPPCAGRGFMTDRFAEILDLEFAGEEIRIVVDSAQPQVIHAVWAVDQDGVPVVLGAFDDPGVVALVGKDGYQLSGEVVVPIGLPIAGLYSISKSTQKFGAVIGDFDGDGSVTGADYIIIDLAESMSIGHVSYRAAVDFDLDGEVTIAEADRARDIIDIVIDQDTEPCPADITKDGAVNVFDLLAFLAFHAEQAPEADWDQSGDISIFDLLGFLDAFLEGCWPEH